MQGKGADLLEKANETFPIELFPIVWGLFRRQNPTEYGQEWFPGLRRAAGTLPDWESNGRFRYRRDTYR